MAIKKRSNTKKSHKPLGTKKKVATPDTITETLIAKMVFSADNFEDEAAVEAFLDDAEWEADTINITKNADGDWEARPNDLEDDDFTKIEKVDLSDDDAADGVEAFVGKREVEVKDDGEDEELGDGEADDDDDTEISTKSDDEDEDEDDEAIEDEAETETKTAKKPVYKREGKAPAKAKKAAPKTKLSKRAEFFAKRNAAKTKTQKFDVWDARFSDGNTLAKTLADGMDYDKTPPGYQEVSIAFSAAVGNILSDDGLGEGKQDALNQVSAQYAEIIGGLDTFFDAYVDSDEETLAKAFTADGELEAVQKWADEYADSIAAETEQKSVKKSLQSTASDNNVVDFAATLKKALEPVFQQIGDVTETVEAMATRSPTKKAADTSDGEPAAPRKVAKKDDSKEATKTFMQKAAEKSMFG